MNPDLDKLHPYPFEKLATLKSGITPEAGIDHIALSIGEPKHKAPEFVLENLSQQLHGVSAYPLTKGIPGLRQAITEWLTRRFNLPSDSLNHEQHVIPVNGTREALFAFAQAVIDRNANPLIVMPNPFYQIYEGAAYLSGAEPFYINTTADNNYLPDFDSVSDETWQRCQLLYICSPGNPTGAVIDKATLKKLISLAEKFDFIIASDECYSEIYFDEANPPVGLLDAAAGMGNTDYSRCVVFHSLSKRSNLPGLRSGFVAGDKDILNKFLKYRTYHGCAMPLHHQQASIKAWQDESHVEENRRIYQEKFTDVLKIISPVMDVKKPDASFYLWAKTPGSDQDFARDIFARQNMTVLPGSYLSREAHGINPGSQHVRMALVASYDECIEAAHRIRQFLGN
ncbi:MAG: succinyldiaminopimelate transaminase [Gammaproteobacteria bacterium]|nr:succinyldiaminopimelate transaminase [Gammaproteobacteria bacterium]